MIQSIFKLSVRESISMCRSHTVQRPNIFCSLMSFFWALWNYVKRSCLDYFSHIKTLGTNIANNLNESYQMLPDDVKHMIFVGVGAYLVIFVCSLVVSHCKKYTDYRSKTRNCFAIYETLHFLVTTILSSRLLSTIGYGMYLGNLNPSAIGHQFFILVIVSLFMYIPRGTFPIITEIIVDHTMIPFSILYHVMWSRINLVFITMDSLVVLLSPLFGYRAFYLTMSACAVNTIVATYGFLCLGNILSLFVAIHSLITLMICVDALRRVKLREKQAVEQNRKNYEKKMDGTVCSVKGNIQKDKKLRRLLRKKIKKGSVSASKDDDDMIKTPILE